MLLLFQSSGIVVISSHSLKLWVLIRPVPKGSLLPLFENQLLQLEARQGDTLSPKFFKIFINDLVDIFGNDCDAVSLRNFDLNCLMYADDVILLSESKVGLQNCLKKLYRYCEVWYLDINID